MTIEDSVNTIEQLVYVADTQNSKVPDDISIPSWQLQKYQLLNLSHTYSTNFGDRSDGEGSSTYSAMRFELLVSRLPSYFVWKLLFLAADIVRDEKPEAIARVRKIDRAFLLANSVILIGGVTLLLLL